jgi:hypothetical protein
MTPASRFPNLIALLKEWETALAADRTSEVSAALASLFPALRIGAQAVETEDRPRAPVLPAAHHAKESHGRALPISG